jgi:tRNA (adenine37-N6)-methyltransferase
MFSYQIGIAFSAGLISALAILTLIDKSSKAHEHCKRKIATERTGRINAEKLLRSGVVEKISDPSIGYPLLVIGHVRSPFKARRGTPRQGLLVPDSRAMIKLSNEIPIETMQGLDTYSHLFVQFLFHENTNLVKTILSPGTLKGIDNNEGDKKALNSRASSSKSSSFSKRVHSFASKVLPPLLSGGSIGVFATRAPHRPNAIGLSLVKIVSVDLENRSIVVSGSDLVNGTPVVDLKPWGPFDCPTCLHNIVDHSGIVPCGEMKERCINFSVKIPDWVGFGLKHPYKLPVVWNKEAEEALIDVVKSGKCLFYASTEISELMRAIEQMLGLDLRSVHRGRGGGAQQTEQDQISHPEKGHRILSTDLIGDISKGAGGVGTTQNYEVDYDVFNIQFRVTNGGHKVFDEPWILIERILLINGKFEYFPVCVIRFSP